LPARKRKEEEKGEFGFSKPIRPVPELTIEERPIWVKWRNPQEANPDPITKKWV